MNTLFLMRNPELFQGEKYLEKNTNYFEGWYFKNNNNYRGIAFIPGISIDNKNRKAFIQVITDEISYFVDYNIEEFKFNSSPFSIKIGNNLFSKDGIVIDIKDKQQNLTICGEIKYVNTREINTNFLYPNIMGPFSYIPFMECNHAILSMQNDIYGSIKLNNDTFDFNYENGYIEKDWGCSFPKSYIWCQANHFKKQDTSFMLSIADIPFKVLNFRGIICVVKVEDKEFKFTTYNNTKLIKYDIKNSNIDIILKKGSYTLSIKSNSIKGNKLVAPIKGKMQKDIVESISASIQIILKKGDTTIFSDISSNCGLEIV